MMDVLSAILSLRFSLPSNNFYGFKLWSNANIGHVMLKENFIYFVQAIRKQPMTIYGDGKQTRSFQYVSDLVW